MMKDKKKKNNITGTGNRPASNTNPGENKGWKNYLTSFWK